MVKAVVGANWGDEGKGKITDMLGKEADIIVRFQGGANAGHTIVNNYGKFALHTLPSGVFYDHTTSIIGNGVALDIPVLFKEIQSIVDRGVPKPKILVSDRAQIVMSYHKNFDAYEEERLGKKSFGSTKSGIAPFYSDKYAKIGFQVSELFDDDLLKEKTVRIAEQKNVLLEHLYHKPLINPDDLYKELTEYREMIAPYVCDVSLYLHNALKEGKNILLVHPLWRGCQTQAKGRAEVVEDFLIAGRGGPVGFIDQDVVIKISCLAGQELVLGNGLDGREGVAGLLVAGPGQKGEVAVLATDNLFEGLKGLAGDLFPVD